MSVINRETENRSIGEKGKSESLSAFGNGGDNGAKISEGKKAGLLKISEAARSAVYSKNYILSSIKNGRMKGEKIGGSWYTKNEWIDEFAKESGERKKELVKSLSNKLAWEEKKKNIITTEIKIDRSADHDLLPTSFVAGETKYSKNYLLHAAKFGRLKALKIKGVWHTKKEWVEELEKSSEEKKKIKSEKASEKLAWENKQGEEEANLKQKKEVEEKAPVLVSELPVAKEKAKTEWWRFAVPVGAAGAMVILTLFVNGIWQESLSRQMTALYEKGQKTNAGNETGLNVNGRPEDTAGVVAGEKDPETNQNYGNEIASLSENQILSFFDHNLTFENIAEHSVRRWNLNSNSVNSKKIKDYAVEARDLSTNAVNSRSIEDRSIESQDLAKNIKIAGYFETGENAVFGGDVNIQGELTIGGGGEVVFSQIGTEELNVGGGYGDSGATINTNGNIQANGNITADQAGNFNSITVSDTTQVDNLNADRVDGYHASAFLLESSILGNENYLPKYTGEDTLGNSTIYDNGNIGVGTANPGAKLEVVGQVKITGGSPGLNKILTSDANGLASWSSLSSFGVSSVSNSDGTLTVSPTSGAVIASLNLSHSNSWTASQTFTASSYFPGSGIWNTSGNVGIGTTNPQTALDVGSGVITTTGAIGIGTNSLGTDKFKVLVDASNYFTIDQFPRLIFIRGATSNQTFGTGVAGEANNRFIMHAGGLMAWGSGSATQDVGISRGAAGKLYVNGGTTTDYAGTLIAGNVGIGTTAPSEKFQVYNGNAYISGSYGSETLSETDFATHAKWDTTGDFNDTGGNAVYTHSTGVGTLTQTAANLVTAGVGSVRYEFTYTISALTHDDGDMTAIITNSFANEDTAIDISEGTHTISFISTAIPGDFVVSITSDTAGDTFTMDDVSLKQAIGGNLINVAGLITGGGAAGIKITTDGRITGGGSAGGIFIKSNGNVGIGTTNPAGGMLQIVTPTNTSYGIRVGDYTNTSNYSRGIFVQTANDSSYGGFISYSRLYAALNPTKFVRLVSHGTNGMIDTSGDFYFLTGRAGIGGYNATFERMRITDTGNVGIGTVSPASLLDVNGTAWLRGATDGTGGLYVNSSGNVGIGTTGPGAKLSVLDTTGTTNYPLAVFTGASSRFVSIIDNDGVGGAGVVTTNVYGSTGATGTLSLKSTDGNANRSQVVIGSIYSSDNGGISFFTAGASVATERMRIVGTSGNVGIGTTNPGAKLEVNGNQINSGNLYFGVIGSAPFINSSGSTLQLVRPDGIGGATVTAQHITLVSGKLTSLSYGALLNTVQFIDSVGPQLQGELIGSERIVKAVGWDGAYSVSFRANKGYFDSNVGIGTTGPGAKLDVVGKIAINGIQTIYNPSVMGTFSGTLVIGNGGTNLSHVDTEDAYYNTFVGIDAGLSNTTGRRNSVLGYQALKNNTSGILNTAIGWKALYTNSAGSDNTAVGHSALNLNTGSDNTALGNYALTNNSSGTVNTAVGATAAYNNTIGSSNSVFGMAALYQNKTGSANAIFGEQAGRGVTNSSDISNNAIFGYRAGYSVLTGANNNVMFGNSAGYLVTTGANNTLLGFQVGNNLTTGSNNIILGYDIDAPAVDSANMLNIGNLIFATGLNGTGTTLSNGNVGIGTTNPGYKLDVQGGYVNASSGLCINGSCQTTWNNIVMPTGTNGQTLYNSSGTWTASSNLFHNGTNVGIGTTNPGEKLDVNGRIAIENVGAAVADNSPFVMEVAADQFNAATTALYIHPRDTANHRIFFGSPDATKTVYALDFSGMNSMTNLPVLQNVWMSGTNSDQMGFGWDAGGHSISRTQTTNNVVFNASDGGYAGGGNYIWYTGTGGYPTISGSAARMMLTNAGNVGIGTTNPGYKLEVSGTGLFTDKVGIKTTVSPTGTLEVRGSSYDLTYSGLTNSSFSIVGNSAGTPYTLDTTYLPYDYTHVGVVGIANDTTPTGYNAVGVLGIGNGGYLYAIGGRFAAQAYDVIPAYGVRASAISYAGANGYGIYIDAGSGPGTNFGLFQSGASDKNYFAGNVGIGTTNPEGALQVASGQILMPDGVAATPSLAFGSETGLGFSRYTAGTIAISKSGTDYYRFYTGTTPTLYIIGGNATLRLNGTYLVTDTNNYLAQRNTSNAQTFRLYNTYTDASNYERLAFSAVAGGAYTITPEAAGTGTVRDLALMGSNVGIGTTNPTGLLHLSSADNIRFILGSGTDGTGQFSDIMTNTADGSDDRTVRIGGGGNVLTDRGAFIELNGNEATGVYAGNLRLFSGTAGNILLNPTGGGSVGIGTTSPQTLLDISQSSTAATQLRLTNTRDGSWNQGDIFGGLEWKSNDATTPYINAAIRAVHLRAGTGHANSDAGLVFYTGGTTDAAARMSIPYTGGMSLGSTYYLSSPPTNGMIVEGNVGIGTSSPQSGLDVSTTTGGVVTLSRSDTTANAGDSLGKIQFWNNDSQLTTQNIYANIEAQADQTVTTDAAAGNLIFRTTGADVAGSPIERMRIISGGNVGIGTSNPSEKLEVAGGNLRVWSDSELGSEQVTSWTNHSTQIYETFTASGTDITQAANTVTTGSCYSNAISAKAGTLYKVTFNMTNNGAAALPAFRAASNIALSVYYLTQTGVSGSNTVYFYAPITTTIYVGFYTATGVQADFSVSNFSVKQVTSGNVIAGGQFTGGGLSGIKVDLTGNVGIGTTNPGQALELVGSLKLEDTTSSTTGVIYKGANSFIHNYHNPTGGGAVPAGYNTFVGIYAGNFTMGSTATQTYHGSYNTAVGDQAFYNNTTGYRNTAVGRSSLFYNTTGYSNTALGFQTLYYNDTGYFNVAVGSYAGQFLADGSSHNETTNQSLYIGYNTKASADGVTNENVIGYNATGLGNDTFLLGNSSVTKTVLNGNVGIGTTNPGYKFEVNTGSATGYVVTATGAWGNTSDERLKKNIDPMGSSLDAVMALKPVTYNLKTENDSDPAHIGFIAQDVEKISPDLVSTGPDGYKGISYAMFAPLLTKAIQEQQTLITNNSQAISTQQTALTDVNLRTTQNVETIAALQQSVDENLAVIGSTLNSHSQKLALDDTNIQDSVTDIADLKTRLSSVESELIADENNLATFQEATNDTISSMLETENMLTERILSHEDRIKALEDRLATMTVSADGATVTIPANVLTIDADGNVTLAGVFEAKEVVAGKVTTDGIVAGAIDVKEITLSNGESSGRGTILAGQTEIVVPTTQASESVNIYITPRGDNFGRTLFYDSVIEGESFKVKIKTPAEGDIKFNWLIVK